MVKERNVYYEVDRYGIRKTVTNKTQTLGGYRSGGYRYTDKEEAYAAYSTLQTQGERPSSPIDTTPERTTNPSQTKSLARRTPSPAPSGQSYTPEKKPTTEPPTYTYKHIEALGGVGRFKVQPKGVSYTTPGGATLAYEAEQKGQTFDQAVKALEKEQVQQQFATSLFQKQEEAAFKVSFGKVGKELEQAGFKTTAAQVFVGQQRGQTSQQVLLEKEPSLSSQLFISQKPLPTDPIGIAKMTYATGEAPIYGQGLMKVGFTEKEILQSQKKQRQVIREEGTFLQKTTLKAKDIYGDITYKIRETKITPTKTYGEVMARSEWGWEQLSTSLFKKAKAIKPKDQKLFKISDPYVSLKTAGWVSGAVSGMIGTTGRHPLSIPAYALAGSAFTFTTTTISGLGPAAATTTKVVSLGLGGAYAVSTGIKYKTIPTEVGKAKFLGRETLKIGAFALGAPYGVKPALKFTGYLRTRGLTLREPSKIITQEVLTGKKLFPTGSQKTHYTEFVSKQYQLPGRKELGVWHAASLKKTAFTPIIKKGGVVGIGKEYLPGGFVSPSLSPYFLKITPTQTSLYGWGVPGGRPTALYIYPKGIKTLKGSPASMWKFLTTKAQKGYAYIPGKKAEIEALIPPGTKLAPLPTRYYSVWEGVKFPIKEFKVSGISAISGKVTTTGAISSAYSLSYTPYQFVSPFTLAGVYGAGKIGQSLSYTSSKISPMISGMTSYPTSYKPFRLSSYQISYKPTTKVSGLMSYKPPKVSTYKPSGISISKPSISIPTTYYKPVTYKPSYEPSKISYKPSSLISSLISYKPSTISSYKPSKISSYKPSIISSYSTSRISSKLSKAVSYRPYRPYKPYKPYESYKPYRPSRSYVSYYPRPKYDRPPPPLIPLIKIGEGIEWKKKRKLKLKRKFKYRPTITAAHYDLTGFKAPKYLTGLEHRPII